MESTKEATDQSQFLTFYLHGEEYAVSILRVREIIEFDTLTKIPAMPPYIRGVLNLRGSVVPVVDLRVKFGLSESPVTPLTCIIIVEIDLAGEQTVMGMIADTVSEVMEFQPKDIEAPPAFGTRIRMDYIRGMGKVGKKFVMILDIDRILSAGELIPSGTSHSGPDSGTGSIGS
jgi:purine-binding chemotaxis protein CheW